MSRFGLRWVVSLSFAAIALLTVSSRLNAQPKVEAVNRVAVGGSVAEIISATPDGNTIAFTNAEEQQVGFIDIRDVKAPVVLGAVDLSAMGEPTSVAMTPNGQYALVAVLDVIDSTQTTADQKLGTLVFIDVGTRQIAGQVALTGIGPDSVAITPDGSKAIVAIEDEEDTDQLPGQRSGAVNFVTIDYNNPAESQVSQVALSDLSTIPGVNYPTDVQPEFVAINGDGSMAAVSLQENNAIALFNVVSERLIRVFSAGETTHQADLKEDGKVELTESFTGRREPDALAFTPDGQYLIAANEGDTETDSFAQVGWSGGRNWSIFDLNGNVIYDSGDAVEALAAQQGAYPDDRSEKRGIELEGATLAIFNGQPIAIMASERGNFIVVYEVSDVKNPKLIGFFPTGESPEGVLALPQRNLILTANEGDGSIDFFSVSE